MQIKRTIASISIIMCSSDGRPISLHANTLISVIRRFRVHSSSPRASRLESVSGTCDVSKKYRTASNDQFSGLLDLFLLQVYNRSSAFFCPLRGESFDL